jgi:AraC-like DNA-binding protein
MSHDPLSDVLRSVRLRGAVFWYVSCRDEWVAESPATRDIGDVVMPGAEHVLGYHLIVKGSSWAAADGAQPVLLGPGEIVMFPRGDAHVLSSAPGLRAPSSVQDQRMLHALGSTRPMPVAYHGSQAVLGAVPPTDEASTIVVCGFIGCDLRPFNPLIEALPRLLALRAHELGAWVAPVLHQAVAESRASRAGSAALLERVSEMVFVDAARRYLDTLAPDASGWFAALRDRYVGKAIGLLHQAPAQAWTIDELGRQVGLSRSALHERFVELAGQPPMQYLANWRMQCGARLLRESNAKVAEIALEVGYDSEAAFARAFKRLVGEPPAAWRRAQRAAPRASAPIGPQVTAVSRGPRE